MRKTRPRAFAARTPSVAALLLIVGAAGAVPYKAAIKAAVGSVVLDLLDDSPEAAD